MSDLELKITGDPSGAVNAMVRVKESARDFSHEIGQVSSEVAGEIGKMIAEFYSLEKVVEGVVEGIGKADEIRDLTLSLGVFTGSMEAGREAMEHFQKAAMDTRNTGDELAKVYRDVLPVAISKGFSQESMQQITVWLSKFATVSGQTIDTVENAFERIMSGHVKNPAMNPILGFLGITDINNLSFEKVITGIQGVADQADQFGQSWESTMHKAKDALLESFGEGFNDARGSSEKGMAGVIAAVEMAKPFIHDIGKEIGDIAPVAVRAFEGAGGSLRTFFGGIEVTIGGVISGVGKALGESWKSLAAFGMSLPPWQKALIKLATGTDVDAGAQGMWNVGQVATDLGATGSALAMQGAENVRAGVEMIGNAQNPLPGITTAAHETAGMNDELRKMLEHLGNIKAEGDKAARAAAEGVSGTARLIVRDTMKQIGMVPWELTPSDYSAPGQGLPINANQIFNSTLTPNALSHDEQDRIAREMGALQAKSFHDAMMQQHFVEDFGNTFAALLETGGHNFVEIIASGMRGTVADAVKDLTEKFFGVQGDKAKGQDPAHRYVTDALGNVSDVTERAKYGQEALGFAQTAASGYAAGQSGQPGSRTAAVVGGAITGFETAGIYGAVIGAAIGLISSALGAQQRQADYKYGVPGIDSSGVAYFNQSRNITDAAEKQMIASIQAAYDGIRDALVRDIYKYTDVAMPGQALNGKFQDNPSGHFMEHFDSWLHDTLPREELGLFKEELKNVAGTLGMTGTAFDEFATKIANLDPMKQAGIYGQLFSGLADIQQASAFFHTTMPMETSGKADLYYAGGMAYGASKATLPGDAMREADAQIIKLANSIKSLSPEGQAAAIQQLGQAEVERMNLIKQSVQALYQASEQFHASAMAMHDDFALQQMKKADGSSDFYAMAQFEEKKANEDLAALHNARNLADAQKYSQAYLRDIGLAEQYGVQDAANDPEKQKAWAKWADEQVSMGEAMFNQVMAIFGDNINKEANDFNAQIDPVIQAFVDGTTTLTTNTTGLGDDLGGLRQPIRDAGTEFANLVPKLGGLASAVVAAMDAINSAVASGGTGSVSAPSPSVAYHVASTRRERANY